MKEKLSILGYYLYFKLHFSFKNRVQLRSWQIKQIEKFKKEVLVKSHFYKRFHNYSLEQYPIIDKKIMMDNFDQLNTVGINKDIAFQVASKAEHERNFTPTLNGITVGLSSGTSGNRGLFVASKSERNKWTAFMLYKALPKGIFSKEKIAFFLRANSNLYNTLNNNCRMRLRYYDLLISIESNIIDLNNYQPSILVAPAQVLKLLAKAKQNGSLAIAPHKIISIAEVLSPEDKFYIGKIFNQAIHQIYQATEGFLAISCNYGTIHLNEEFIYFEQEWIDDKRFIPIIYDFTRTSQPIWKYRLNDILVIKEQTCPCGSPNIAIEMIEGRCDDVFYFKTINNEVVPVFPDFIRKIIIESSPEIEDYKVTQLSNYDIYISIKDFENTDIKKTITERFRKFLKILNVDIDKIIIVIKFVENIEQNLTSKLRRVERKYNFA